MSKGSMTFWTKKQNKRGAKMRQVFRLMDMPDRVIAFDELPEDLVSPFEMHDCSKLPREWRDFIGVRERHIKIKPEFDPLTRQWVKFPELTEKAPYAYLMDREINQDKEAWAAIEDYVKRNAPKDFRLMDKIASMARPMANDSHSELSLEVEDVVVIPLPKVSSEKEPTAVVEIAKAQMLACGKCGKEFEKKQALRMHVMKKHSEKEPAKEEPKP